jgi:hypothetical protein
VLFRSPSHTHTPSLTHHHTKRAAWAALASMAQAGDLSLSTAVVGEEAARCYKFDKEVRFCRVASANAANAGHKPGFIVPWMGATSRALPLWMASSHAKARAPRSSFATSSPIRQCDAR